MKTFGTPGYRVANGELAFTAGVALNRIGLSDGEAFLVLSNAELAEIATERRSGARPDAERADPRAPATSRDGEEPPRHSKAKPAGRSSSTARSPPGGFSTRHSRSSSSRDRAVTAAGGPAAEWLVETLEAGGENGRTIAELGIGTNPGATITVQSSKTKGEPMALAWTSTLRAASQPATSAERSRLGRDDGAHLLREKEAV
jgi:hypothetical protein